MRNRWILLAGLALLLIGGYRWLSQPERLPPGLAAAGEQYDVEILRDVWGVPHVFGTTDADVAYGLAFAHAEDDFATIQGALLAARGQLASVYGRDAAPNDYMVHLLRHHDTLRDGYPTLDAKTQALCQAYADGLNHYAALHPEAALPGLYPMRGADVIAGFLHKVPLFFGLDRVLGDLFSEEWDAEADTTTLAESFHQFGRQPLGSNAFAIAPSRTADSSTFLAVNSHQPWTGPVAWYEAHLHSEEGWDMVGGTFPGAPLILHGHNRHLGWAHTVNHPDLIDVYRLEIDPDDADRYRYGDRWETLETREAPIRVKLWGPFSWTFTREVLWSIYGPVVRRPHGTYAIRYAGFGEVRQVEQWYRMNKATTFAAWQDAVRMQALPSFNIVYADQSGTTYYLYNGLLPLRHAGHGWQGIVAGNTPQTLWTTYLPFDQLPQVLNPPSGFVQNTNASPFATTVGPGNPADSLFAETFGIETYLNNRTRRARTLFAHDTDLTWSEFVRYKYDMTYDDDSRMAALIADFFTARALRPDLSVPPEVDNVLGLWDRRVDPENPHAALPVMAFQPFLEPTTAMPDAETIFARLTEAAATLTTHFGRLDPPWFEVQRLRRGDTDIGLGGGPDVLHAVHSTLADDGRLVGHAGDSYVLLVAWDADGAVRSHSIHPFGSATLDATSPHYADQSQLFTQRGLKPVWMDEADIRANLKHAYRPGE